MSPRHRRDFLLDSGAVSAFAADPRLLEAYIKIVNEDFTGSLLIPIPVLTEIRTGEPRHDVIVDRLINTLRGEQEDVYVPLTVEIATRAGVLRTQALASSNQDISAIDAQIVATAEELSHHSAVTILTSDTNDIGVLVNLTRRTNIAVDIPG